MRLFLQWALATIILVRWVFPAGATAGNDSLSFEETAILSISELDQFRSNSVPLAQPETTVDETALEQYAEQIFIGSIWMLQGDGTASFEFGPEYDLEDFGISEEQSVLNGTWTEKRNGERAVDISYDEQAADFSSLIMLSLQADIAVGEDEVIAAAHYTQSVTFANWVSAAGDTYQYSVELELTPLGSPDQAETAADGAEAISLDDAAETAETADGIIAVIEDGFADSDFTAVEDQLVALATDEASEGVAAFVDTLEWYGQPLPGASLDCDAAIAGSHGGAMSWCELDGVVDDDAVEELLGMTHSGPTDEAAEVGIDVGMFFDFEADQLTEVQFVADALELSEQLADVYEPA
jgi:hypothetical protein